MLGQIGGAVLMLAFAAVPTVGQTIESAYTKFNTKNCQHVRGVDVESYGSWVCPGYAGLRVRLSAGDQRMHRQAADFVEPMVRPGMRSGVGRNPLPALLEPGGPVAGAVAPHPFGGGAVLACHGQNVTRYAPSDNLVTAGSRT